MAIRYSISAYRVNTTNAGPLHKQVIGELITLDNDTVAITYAKLRFRQQKYANYYNIHVARMTRRFNQDNQEVGPWKIEKQIYLDNKKSGCPISYFDS